MDGKVVVVTGATSGLGLAAAEGFAQLGATVWLLARSEERGERARAGVAQRTGNEDVCLGLCDVSHLGAVREFAERFAAESPRLDVLVNNAGVMTAERTLSADGIELTFATNVLGPFLLTNLLLGVIRASAPARIVNVSSGGMYTQRLDAERSPERARRLRRRPGLRAHEARGGDPHRAVGRAAAGERRDRACDAPGLGRHAGRRAFAAGLLQGYAAC